MQLCAHSLQTVLVCCCASLPSKSIPHMHAHTYMTLARTQIFNDEHRPELLRKSAEKSVAELGHKYVDLMLLHW